MWSVKEKKKIKWKGDENSNGEGKLPVIFFSLDLIIGLWMENSPICSQEVHEGFMGLKDGKKRLIKNPSFQLIGKHD